MNAPMHRSRVSRIAAAALAALLGLAATAEAQMNTRNGNSRDVAATGDVGRAMALESEANSRLVQLNGYARTASLFERAARLRPDEDPQRIEDLRMAGLLYRNAGRHDTARRILEAGAKGAMQYGNIVSAAHMLIDAAWIARVQGDVEALRRLTRKADCLSRSQHITVADAAGIRQRIGASAGVLVVR
jgi:hypothetical protein